MRTRLTSLASALSLLFSAAALAQPVQPPLTAQPASPPAAVTADHGPQTRELALREAEKQKLVSLSLAVARNGKIVFEDHIGFEDREAKTPAGPATMYRWASISKPVTAAAAMMLVEAGKFELDADVRTLVPEFPQKPWIITPRQLLCHQAGVVHYSNGKVIALPVPAAPEHPYEDLVRALDTFKESPLISEPGTKYNYTTHGYMLLGAAVERASGQRYWQLVRDWIAVPTGMTTFQPDYQWVNIPHRAVGYHKDASGEVVKSTNTDVSWKLPGGGFISSVSDLSRFSIALVESQLVSPQTFALMRTPQKLKDGEATKYGLGLNVGTLAGRPTASHSGAQEKTSTYMLLLPDDRLSVVLMTNTEGASLGSLASAVATEWLEIAAKPPVQPAPATHPASTLP